jgi:YVTN family beta-propeller protein
MVRGEKMKTAAVLALLLFATLASGQWLETTIVLADTGRPYALCYNSQNNKVYCANWYSDNVIVIDGATNDVLATVPAGSYPWALCYNSQNNRVYCANNRSGSVTVIDGATSTVLATVRVGSGPSALCYNPQGNKVYCANDGSGTVTVIDGASNRVLATVAAGASPRAFCYNLQNDKIYCEGNSTLTVIDGTDDRVIISIPGSYVPQSLCYNSRDNKIHFSEGSLVKSIDGNTDEFVGCAIVPLNTAANLLCYNPRNDKVYGCGTCVYPIFHFVAVVDAAGDSWTANANVVDGLHALCYDSLSNKLYAANGSNVGYVSVIDGATNAVLDTIGVGPHPYALTHNPVQNRVYVANFLGHSISVIRDSMPVGVEETPDVAPVTQIAEPTVVSCVLSVLRDAASIVYDAQGRRVREPGPGVYFLREQIAGSSEQYRMRKVIITR